MSSPVEQDFVTEFIRNSENPVILDVGAHCGEEERWMRMACNERVTYVAIEPDPRNVQMILGTSIDWSREGINPEHRRVIIGAIGAAMPEDPRSFEILRPFHLSENEKTKDHGSGSLLEPSGHIDAFPWIKFPASTLVPCYTLDYIFDREWLSKIDLLWVDIQGAEREMIAGGQKALKHARFCFIEAEDVELYAGEALKPELVEIFHSMGWSLVHDFGFNLFFRNDCFEERGPR